LGMKLKPWKLTLSPLCKIGYQRTVAEQARSLGLSPDQFLDTENGAGGVNM
jgi:hypothetical protein